MNIIVNKVFLSSLLIFAFNNVFTQTSKPTGGDWHIGTTWIAGSVPPTNNATITVDGPVFSDIDLTFNNNVNLTINANDTLTVNGNLSFNNGANFTINEGAVVIVRGDFVSNNNLTLEANAYLIVLGNLTLNNNSDINSSTIPSQVFVGGTADWGHGTTGNVLDCPGSTGYNSDCNYGNIIDLINDPIFENISTNCTPAPYYNTNGEPSSNSPVDEGSTINLLADPNPGSGASFTIFVWTGPNDFSYSSSTTPNTSIASASASLSGEYIFAAFTDAGCYLIDTIAVVVNSCSSGTIGNNNNICSGDIVPEIISITSPSSNGTLIFSWYSSINSTDPTSGTWSVITDSSRVTLYPGTLSQTTSYFRLVTAGGCTDTSNVVTVTVNPLPMATITINSSQDTLCDGNAPEMDINFTSGLSPYNFTITYGTNPESFTNISANPYTYMPGTVLYWVDDGSPDTDYTYTISIITDSNGCSNTNQGSGLVTIFKIPECGPQYHISNTWGQ